MMNVLTDKVIQVFNTEEIKQGDFITCAYRDVEDEGGYTYRNHWNGMVFHVSDRELKITKANGAPQTLSIGAITDGRVKILGIAKDVIERKAIKLDE